MRRKIFSLLMAAGMMVLGIAGCGLAGGNRSAGDQGQAGEDRNAGDQEQTGGRTEETEAKESDAQGNGQSASSQENTDVQGASSMESSAPEAAGAPVVYMTTDISSAGLMAIYEALGASPEGSIAVKLSTGEPGSNYLRTDLIGELVQSLDASIVDSIIFGGV